MKKSNKVSKVEVDSTVDETNTTGTVETTIISETTESEQSKTATKPSTQNKERQKKIVKPETKIPRGLPKSNRPWKTPKQKFSQIKKTVNRLSYEKKVALRNEMRYIKEKSKEIKDQRKEAAVQRHQRRVENAERRLANERRSEIVQVIKNPAKLKRMKKKQMRMIEKRDLSQVKVV